MNAPKELLKIFKLGPSHWATAYSLFFTKTGVLYNKQKSIGDQVTKLQSDFLKCSNHHPTKPGGPKDL